MKLQRLRLPVLALPLVLSLGSCLGEVEPEPAGRDNQRATLFTPPRGGFDDVAEAMQPRCGTLDCHGQPGRNLILYGGRGLRLKPEQDSADGVTTDEEYDATYWSVVALEPEAISSVVRDGGRDSWRLSLLRKADGTEKHKGGRIMRQGDPLDRCLKAWLAGRPDSVPCLEVKNAERPKL